MDGSLGSPIKTSLQPKDKSSSQQGQISCKICNKKFYSSQALGGHQNAHRQERLMVKARSAEMEQPLANNMGKFYLNPHLMSTTNSSSPFYGGLNNSFDYRNRPGISMNSLMIHKPIHHPRLRPAFNLFGHGHRHDYWPSKMFGNPKFEIENGWNGKEDREKSSCLMNLPEASEELDLTLKL